MKVRTTPASIPIQPELLPVLHGWSLTLRHSDNYTYQVVEAHGRPLPEKVMEITLNRMEAQSGIRQLYDLVRQDSLLLNDDTLIGLRRYYLRKDRWHFISEN